MSQRIPAYVDAASEVDLKATRSWQTKWTSVAAKAIPNKVALHRTDDGELLVLMSYEIDYGTLAVEIIYIESAAHSNANLLRVAGQSKKYIGIARALIAYAALASVDAGFDGVLFFKAKTDDWYTYPYYIFALYSPMAILASILLKNVIAGWCFPRGMVNCRTTEKKWRCRWDSGVSLFTAREYLQVDVIKCDIMLTCSVNYVADGWCCCKIMLHLAC